MIDGHVPSVVSGWMLEARFNHIAFLVRSVCDSAEIEDLGAYPKGPAEKWDGEGTLEIYVGPEKAIGRLLLMEPIADGAYRRAMEKRGPGLHHIAIDVLDIEAYISYLSGTGWLLHPQTIKTLKASRTAYLARPGIPMLIEVQERKEFSAEPLFIDRVELSLPPEQFRILNCLRVRELVPSHGEGIFLSVGGLTIDTSGLISATKSPSLNP